MTTPPAKATERPTTAPGAVSTKPVNGHNGHSKILSRRSSKPILNWLQRKLGSSSKMKKTQENLAPPVPPLPKNRVVSSPVPGSSPSAQAAKKSLDSSTMPTRRKTISLNEEDDERSSSRPVTRIDDIITDDGSSVARDSTWSPTNASADEDASMRRLPGTPSPPSPSPSRDSSSYISDPKTFKSIAASTKPTTLLSIDLNGGGMAHIAQAPAITPNSAAPNAARLNPTHGRNGSTATDGAAGSISFSALPPSTPTSTTAPVGDPLVQAPQHTTHHPRYNPRPSSPPLDNASTFTLASSAYAIPSLRQGHSTATAASSGPPSAMGVATDGVSISLAGSTYADAESSHFPLGEDDRDVDASVRALRPRSSRRGSWESEVSRWSARPGGGTPISRSLWTGGGSVKTGGGFSADGTTAEDDRASNLSRDETAEDGPIIDVTEDVASVKTHAEEPVADKLQDGVNGVVEVPKDGLEKEEANVVSKLLETEEKPAPPPLGERTVSSETVPKKEDAPPSDDTDQTPQVDGSENTPSPKEEQTPHPQFVEPASSVVPSPKLDLKSHPAPISLENGGMPSPTGTEMSERDEVWHSAPSTPAPLQSATLHGF